MHIQPRTSHVLIEPDMKPKETSSGLSTAEVKSKQIDRPFRGYVTATGPDCKEVKVGDHVYFDKFKCIEVQVLEGVSRGDLLEDDIAGFLLDDAK